MLVGTRIISSVETYFTKFHKLQVTSKRKTGSSISVVALVSLFDAGRFLTRYVTPLEGLEKLRLNWLRNKINFWVSFFSLQKARIADTLAVYVCVNLGLTALRTWGKLIITRYLLLILSLRSVLPVILFLSLSMHGNWWRWKITNTGPFW